MGCALPRSGQAVRVTPCSEVSSLLTILRRVTPPSGPESRLAAAVERELAAAGIEYRRESKLSTGRVDLRVGTVAIELKVGGTAADVVCQLSRYMQDSTVTAVVLVTTSAKHRASIPSRISSTPLHVVYLPRL